MQDHCSRRKAASRPYDLWEVWELDIFAIFALCLSPFLTPILRHLHSAYLLALSLHPRHFYAAQGTA